MQHSISHRLLSVILSLLMVLGMFPVTAFADGPVTATLVTDASALAAGDQIVIVAKDYDYALGSTQEGKYRTRTAITKTDDTIEVVEGVQIITLAAGAVNGTWALGVGEGSYLYADTSEKNTLRTGSALAENSSWTITIAEGAATIEAKAGNSTLLQYNDKNTRFSCYKASSNQLPVCIYKVVAAEPDNSSAGLVTDAANLKVGDKIVIASSDGKFALSAVSGNGNYRTNTDITVTSGKITLNEAISVITLEEGKVENTFALKVGEEGYLTAVSGANNLKTEASKDTEAASWTITVDGTTGVATIRSGITEENRDIKYNSSSPRFSCYKSGQMDVAVYEVGAAAGTLTPPVEPEVELSTIAAALAGETDAEFKVKGVVTLVDSSNIYVQDETGAICVRMATKPTDIALGDTIIGTGSRTEYNGLPQLQNSTYEKSEGLTLTAAKTTIDGLKAEDLCEYVELENLTITEISGDNVTLKNGDLTVKGYKLVLGDIVLGDIINFKGALGCFKETLQLRNTTADELTKVGHDDAIAPPPAFTPIADGTNVVIYAPAYNKALSSTKTGYYNVGVDVTVTDGVVSGFTATEIWTAVLNDDGTYSFAQNGQNIGMADKNSSMDLGAKNDRWEITDLGEGLYNIKNTGRGNFMEWYNKFGNWSTYGSSSAATDDQFQLSFYTVPQYAKLDNEIADGEEFIIYYNKDSFVMADEASSEKLGNVAATPSGDFIAVTEGMSVLTATIDADGNYTFVNEAGKYLTSGATGNSLTFEDTASEYSLWKINAVEGGVHIVNVNAKYSGKTQALEVFSGKFTTFSEKDTDYYLFNLYTLTDEMPDAKGDLPEAGDKVTLYNVSAKGVLAAEGDNQVIENVVVTIEGGKVTAGNGAVIFTVEKNGEYFRFKNEAYGYLCSNGTGNNAFYSKEATEDADWKVTKAAGNSEGFNLESRTAKYNGTYSQFLEYYSDSYKSYSMYKVTDYDIYAFQFIEVDSKVNVSEGIVNEPKVDFGELADAYVGMDYTFSFEVDSVFGVDGELSVKVFGQDLTATEGKYTLSKEFITTGVKAFDIYVKGVDKKGVEIYGNALVNVKDEPFISNMTPEAGSETKENKKPSISAEIDNAGVNPTVVMSINGNVVDATYENGVITYTPAEDMAEGRTTVTVTVERADKVTATKSWSFTVGEAQYQLYFGQLHSHTGEYSDGSGTLASALDYIKNLDESANVDFVAFTDHSNYFDSSNAANPEGALYDLNLATAASKEKWNKYVSDMRAFNAEENGVIALPGFEMTWSGGPGHMNTFNTEGIVSRNNSTLNNKTADAGMKAYYALLSQAEGADSINQFNHPGSTFGTFSDFAYWDGVIDSRIQLVEVGNGEGQVGAGGYYPSYEYYTMALDKGWHVAPTNNQDNHKGKWGNANDARDVILTDNFSEEGLYQAIRDKRVYSTEDKNLEIYYTVNEKLLGSQLPEETEKLNINVVVNDPDVSDSISKVEVIVNSGKVAYTWSDPAVLATGNLAVTLEPEYSYYYIRVTQGDGDLAVTAPVWVGETLMLGISSVECGTSTPVTGEELTLTTTLFNSEKTDATVKAISYAYKGGSVISTDNAVYTVEASGTKAIEFKWTPDVAKVTTVTVTVVLEQDGKEYIFTKDIELDIEDASKLVYIGIDASHYNEYVAGNYKDSMGNFGQLAAEYSVRTVELKTSEDLIAACSNPKYKAMIFTAPSRRLAAAQEALLVYTEAEIAAIKAFNANGGTVIFAGWSDNYENYDVIKNNPAAVHMAAAQNAVLKELGSVLRIGDDATYDDVRSKADGVDKWRLYFNTYGKNFLTEGVEVDPANPYDRLYTEVFSHYGGATVYVEGSETIPSTVSPVVFGHATTYSVDVDGDGLGGNIPKYEYAAGDNRHLVMATEQLPGQGLIVVSGAAFMSNFEVQATIEDSGAEKNYSNYKICENLVNYINPLTVSDIADVQAEKEEGIKYTIEGIVTSNASGYDKDTAFFDCIYLQDGTAGINAFPVAGNYKIGDKVRITGTTSSYQGERQIAVTDIELISSGNEVVAKDVTAEEINDGSVLGQLVKVDGRVIEVKEENGLIQTITLKDESGEVARIFIDGYICAANEVANIKALLEAGKQIKVTVTGNASYDNSFDGIAPRIRVSNRANVICEEVPTYSVTVDLGDGSKPTVSGQIYMNQIKDPVREGYIFLGWVDAVTGESLGDDYLVTGEASIKAVWKKRTACEHELDKNGLCKNCGVVIIDYVNGKPVKPSDETNPNTGAPAPVSAVTAIAVIGAAAYVIGKRK